MTTPNKTLNKDELLNQTQTKRSREELLVHWFANHMPAVIKGQPIKRKRRAHAHKYLATVFEESAKQIKNIGTEWHNYGGIKSCQHQTNPTESHPLILFRKWQSLIHPGRP